MLLAFRSIVIALKAIVLNLLSVAAAYGVLVLVFQDGSGRACSARLTGGIDRFMPMFLFVILFGLSMDYHVFILSRDPRGRRPRHVDRRGGRARDQDRPPAS